MWELQGERLIGAAGCVAGAQRCVRQDARVRARAQGVRPPDRQVPGDPAQVRRDGDQDRGRAADGLHDRLALPERRVPGARDLDGQALRRRGSPSRSADECIQIHGGAGYMKEYGVERAWRDMRAEPHRRRHGRDHARRDRPLVRPLMPARKILRAPGSATIESVADGVWLVHGGVPKIMNVYLIEEDGGVVVFDAGSKGMAKAITEAARPLGGINRVVLGHGHTDHRGSAPRLDAPVFCHPDEVEDAEGSGGFRYWGNIRKSNLPVERPPAAPAPAQVLGRRPRGHRRDGVGRPRRGRLPGGARAGPRPRADRAVPRGGPAGALHRPDLHDRHGRPRLGPSHADPRSTTGTPSRRAPRCARSPRWSPRPCGADMGSRCAATYRHS